MIKIRKKMKKANDVKDDDEKATDVYHFLYLMEGSFKLNYQYIIIIYNLMLIATLKLHTTSSILIFRRGGAWGWGYGATLCQFLPVPCQAVPIHTGLT